MKTIFKQIFHAFTIMSSVFVIFALFVFGTQRVRPMLSISQSDNVLYNQFGGQAADTLRAVSSVNDTLVYPFTVNHTNGLTPYFTLTYTKITADPTSVKINFYQSLDNVNWFTLKRPVGRVYTKTISPTSTTTYEYSLINDTVHFEGRFVRVECIMINSSSNYSKASISGKVKFNIN